MTYPSCHSGGRNDGDKRVLISSLNLWHKEAKIVLLSGTGRRCGLMVSALVSGLIGLGLSPGLEHCVMFLGKTLGA